MSSTLREIRRQIFAPIPMVSWALASGACAMAGPFGTFEALNFPWRLAYWTFVIFVSVVLSLGILGYTDRGFPKFGYWKKSVAGSAVFTTIYTGFLYVINDIIFGDLATQTVAYWQLAAIVFLIAVGIITLRYFVNPAAYRGTRTSPFFSRIRPELGQDLVRLATQDHYIEVHTRLGKDLILMRFSDALAELVNFDGIQVHRSHWVAMSAISGVERADGKLVVRMNDGAIVPVSKNHRDSLRSRGLI